MVAADRTPSFRQLELFRLMMRTRNVTETARLLHISQPSASQSLRDLEESMGIELFARTGGRLRPTAEAMALLPTVERLFSHQGLLDGQVAELRDAQAGNLRIATIPTLTGWLMPNVINRFRKERPKVRFVLNCLDAAATVRAVRREDADLGIVYGPIDDPAVAAEPLFQTRMVCIMRPDHPLAASEKVDAGSVAGHTPIVLHGTIPPGTLLTQSIRRSRVPFEVALETNLAFAAATLVREGMGFFIADPLILLSPLGNGLIARPFEPAIALTLALVFSRQRPLPRIVVRFVAKLKEGVDDMANQLHQRGLPGDTIA
jgi:DNA-binding transcriptional LysR family regulator